MRIRPFLSVMFGAIAFVVAGCGSSTEAGTPAAPSSVTTSSEKKTFTFIGSMTLMGTGVKAGDTCSGRGGYNDIREGARVTVYDAAGKIVAIGDLGPGAGGIKGCTFTYAVPGVPTGLDFYQYEISHRGKLTVTEKEALELQMSTLGP